MNYYFTSESVSEGHPDKICDQISDAILDQALKNDPDARVAIETFIKDDLVVIGGEITTDTPINYEEIIRNTLIKIGYTKKEYGIDANNCQIITKINRQSTEIAMGVNKNKKTGKQMGAGDQGLMFGFACNQTPTLMPLPIALAHAVLKTLSTKRQTKTIDYLRPDAKSQITVEYDKNKQVKRIDTIVLSTQHHPEVAYKTLEAEIITKVILETIPKNLIDEKTKYYINPTGKFTSGGPKADSGLTGRKIIVDTYGGWARHGGGSFSGKDPSKVDRSGAYMARYIAKNIIAAKLADEIEIQISYAIGKPDPVSLYIETNNTAKIDENDIINFITSNFDLTPEGIITTLNLKQPIYQQTASYGHFGRNDLKLPWEQISKLTINKTTPVLI